jgi:hypothetical protein
MRDIIAPFKDSDEQKAGEQNLIDCTIRVAPAAAVTVNTPESRKASIVGNGSPVGPSLSQNFIDRRVIVALLSNQSLEPNAIDNITL